MALLYSDGFDVQDILARWTVVGSTSDLTFATATRFGAGKAVTVNSSATSLNSNLAIMRAIPASASVYVGAAVQVGLETGVANDLTANLFAMYGDGGATSHVFIRRLQTNAIGLYRGDAMTGTLGSPSGTPLAISAGGVLDANWRYVEVFATINATTGQVIVRVDGVQVINFTGNTKNGGTSTNIDAVRFRTGRYTVSNNAVFSLDDMYVCDATGTVNNTFLGDVRVQSLVPTAAGSSTQLTPTGSVNNYANVGEIPYNNATYNASPTTGQRDTYALSDLSAGTTTVYGLQSVAYMQKSDAGVANAKVALKSGASVYYDTTQSLSASATPYYQVRETDPATAAAWTVANVNALEAGMEVA